MVARTGRYYSVALRGFQGVTQEYPLSLTIFNVVVDAVVRNWVSLVAGGVEGPDVEGEGGVFQGAIFFYP